MVKQKVKIVITPNNFFCKSVNNGSEYTSVNFNAKNYGSASPCVTNEEINSAIQRCKDWIIMEGDKPIVKDKRDNLNKWF